MKMHTLFSFLVLTSILATQVVHSIVYTGPLIVNDVNTGSVLGYLVGALDVYGEYGAITTNISQAMQVTFDSSSSPFSISIIGVDFYLSWAFGDSHEITHDQYLSDTANFVELAGSQYTPPGSTPVEVSEVSLALGRPFPIFCETSVWTLSGDVLSTFWVNPDNSINNFTLLQGGTDIFGVGDVPAFCAWFGLTPSDFFFVYFSITNEVVPSSTVCCASGYSPSSALQTDCSDALPQSCFDVAPVPGNFSTPALSTVRSVSFASNTLSVVVQSPLVNGRQCTQLSFGTGSNPLCSNFTKSGLNASCLDIWTGSLSWVDAVSSCGFTLDTTSVIATTTWAAYYVFVGEVQVTSLDIVNPLVNRTTTSVHPVYGAFPKTISASSTIVVVSSIVLDAALVSQVISPATAGVTTASLIFSTFVQWPYQLTLLTDSLPAGFSLVSFTEIVNDTSSLCPTTINSECEQQWLLIETTTTNCVLDGNYFLEWTQNCRSSAGVDCPWISGETHGLSSITAALTSDNFCAQSSTQIAITPSLTSYSSSAYTVPQQAFIFGQTVYFTFDAESSQATITSITLLSVSVALSGSSGSTLLYESSPSISEADFGISLSANTHSVNFYFDLSLPLFSIPTASSFVVSATVQLTYTGVSDGKRYITTLNTEVQTTQTSTSTSVTVQPAPAPAPSHTVSGAPSVLATTSLFVCGFVVLFSLV